MFCYNCGTKLPEGAKFCFNCGTKVVDVSSTEASAAPPEPEPKREEPMPAAPIDDD
ncbi:MAG: zinc-ribbon domain-containing protein, partial [Selenomonadaceae bacterium]